MVSQFTRNGAQLALGLALPWKIGLALNLLSGGTNVYEAGSGNELLTGRELTNKERLMRGIFGVLELALAA